MPVSVVRLGEPPAQQTRVNLCRSCSHRKGLHCGLLSHAGRVAIWACADHRQALDVAPVPDLRRMHPAALQARARGPTVAALAPSF